MKNLLKFIVCVLSIVFMMAFKSYRAGLIPVIEIETKPIVLIPIKIKNPKLEIKLTGHQQFLDAIGHRESGNRYNIVNKYGYMGKYQFGRSTLKTLKINVSRSEFINNPKLQEQAMYKLLQYNKKKLKRYIEKYNGRVINGVLVTESGLLAAAHLGGAGSVRKWFRTGKIRRDGNGVKITSYMKQFGGYDLNL